MRTGLVVEAMPRGQKPIRLGGHTAALFDFHGGSGSGSGSSSILAAVPDISHNSW